MIIIHAAKRLGDDIYLDINLNNPYHSGIILLY